MADFLGRRGRTHTFRPLHQGVNVGTTQYEPVDPAATFFAGELAHKDSTTGLINKAVGGAPNNDDLEGGVLGIFGDTKVTTPLLIQVDEPLVVQAAGTVVAQHTNIANPALGSFATIRIASTGVFLTSVQVTNVFTGAGADLPHGLLALNAANTGQAAGTAVLVTYYYQPLDKKFAVGTNDVGPNGAVTIWKNLGQYLVGIYETVDNAGNTGLPKINDPLYCSPNGRLTAFAPAATSQVIAICRSNPNFTNALILIDLKI